MMKKRILCTGIILFFIGLLSTLFLFGVKADSISYASELDFIFLENDFTFIADDRIESRSYSNAEIGSRIRVNMTKEQYENISFIKFTLVKITTINDEITYSAENILKNDKEVSSQDIIKADKVYQSSFLEYENQSLSKYGYIDIVANEFCAIVLDVEYDNGGEKVQTHSSYIYKVTNIDNSKPTAYYTTLSYDVGSYVFRVTVNGNQPKAVRTANSRIRKVEFIKVTGSDTNPTRTTLDTIEGINVVPYYYELRINPTEKALYYAKVLDWVGNESENLIVVFGTHDASFESAVNNTLDELARGKDIYAPHLIKNLADEFALYGLRVQEYVDAPQDKKTDASAKIEKQKNVIYKLLGEFAHIRTLAENGVRDFDVKVINPEYLQGESILIGNVNKAYSTLLYGEVATFTVALADFDLRIINKDAEIKASGLKNVNRALGITLETTNSIKGEVDITFDQPIEIRIPISDYKSVVAVVKRVDEKGNEWHQKLNITEYKSYFLVHMPYSNGIITIVFGKKPISPYYWLLTLLIIPISISAYFIIRHIKVKRQKERERLKQERLQSKEKYVAKNKSKKGKKKKK